MNRVYRGVSIGSKIRAATPAVLAPSDIGFTSQPQCLNSTIISVNAAVGASGKGKTADLMGFVQASEH